MRINLLRAIRILVFVMGLLLPGAGLLAQTVVSGTVSDPDGNPLAGAGVVIKGTHSGTTADANGAWSLTVPDRSAVLEFSYLGMATQEIPLSGQRIINVILREDADFLDEVVVVGYGTQKKVHMTGSVVAMSATELKKSTVSNVSQSLVGKLPGLITQQSLGQPGSDQVSILVRGYSSYNDAGTVLVLVDGVERDMNTVNPADIESISVLKDAAACAVYGMKGANGVILVTTKRGSEGSATVSYTGRLVLSHATALPRMMNGTQYMQYYNLGYQLDQMMNGVTNPQPYFTDGEIAATTNGDLSDGIENTDWAEPLYRTTLMHQHNLSVSGGSNKVNYFISGGYQDQKGFLEGHDNARTNVRSNIDARPTKDILISLNLGMMVQDYNQPGTLSFANATVGGTVPFCLMYALPFVPKTYEGEEYPQYKGMATSAMRTRDAFVANAEYGAQNGSYDRTRTLKLESSAKIEYAFPFLKGLKAAFQFDWDWRNIASKTFAYGYDVMAWSFAERNYELRMCSYALEDGNLNLGEQKWQQRVLRPSISYARKFGKHDVAALLLYEQREVSSTLFSGSRQKFDLLDIDELSFGNASTAINSGSRGIEGYAGYVGRFNYAYDDRYLLEGAFRYDGSYKFARGHRWGFFPSVSAGWVLSKEDFFKDRFPSVDLFKVRASVGETGNDNVTAWLYRKSYGFSGNSVAFGQVAQSTLYNTVSYPFSDLTWERIRTWDAGFEFNAWKGKLGIEFDWFYKYTYNILNSVSSGFPASLGGHHPTNENTGAFDNRGFELSLSHANRIGDFYYRLGGNMSWAHNRILKMRQSDNVLPWQDRIGSSIGDVWGLLSDGLYQTEEDLANAPREVVAKLGDIKYVDYNGDGRINSDDQVKIGRNSRPELMYALQMDASWKGLDFNVLFQGGALCDKYLLGKWSNGVSDATPLTKPWYANYDNAPLYLVENSWRPDNTEAEYPRLSVSAESYSNNYRLSDFWKRDGAYLRLKSMSLGYTLPGRITRKAGIQGLRFFVTGTNLLTLTAFKYLDPESPNVVTGYYPQQRTFTFGLDLSF